MCPQPVYPDELFLLDLKREGASKDYVHKPFQVSGRPCDGDPFGLSSRGVAWRGYIAKEVYHREG